MNKINDESHGLREKLKRLEYELAEKKRRALELEKVNVLVNSQLEYTLKKSMKRDASYDIQLDTIGEDQDVARRTRLLNRCNRSLPRIQERAEVNPKLQDLTLKGLEFLKRHPTGRNLAVLDSRIRKGPQDFTLASSSSSSVISDSASEVEVQEIREVKKKTQEIKKQV